MGKDKPQSESWLPGVIQMEEALERSSTACLPAIVEHCLVNQTGSLSSLVVNNCGYLKETDTRMVLLTFHY